MPLAPYFNDKREVASFAKIMKLKRLDDLVYESVTELYKPTGKQYGLFGGHIAAISLWAAAQTVPAGFVVQNTTGWFTAPGVPNVPLVFTIQKVRDSRNTATRTVVVTQSAGKGVIFTCTCTFRLPETSSIDYQDRTDLKELYSSSLKGKTPMEHPEGLYLRPKVFNPCPGLYIRKPDTSQYNKNRRPHERRELVMYSLRGNLPDPAEDARMANLHAAAHVQASDHFATFAIAQSLGLMDKIAQIASMAHTVIFHVGADHLKLANEPSRWDPRLSVPTEPELPGEPGGSDTDYHWGLQETHTTRAAGGRGIFHSRLFNYQTGVHVATVMQDVLLRFQPDAELKL